MSRDLMWMDPMLAVHLPSTELKIKRLCAVKGASHLYDDVLEHALFTACELGDYDPRRASLETYLVNHAKWYLGDRFRAKEVELPVEFTDDYAEEPWMVSSPSVDFVDPFEMDAPVPCWYKPLWVSLTAQERDCLAYVLMSNADNKKVTYRDLGKLLGVSHVTAGKVLDSVRRKAKDTIQWTTALSALSNNWQQTGVFQYGSSRRL